MSGPSDATNPAEPRLLRFSQVPTSAWRNDAGVTRELYASADSDGAAFDWRVSIADVTADGPFSSFPGVDRTIMLVSGAAMTVIVDEVEHRLVALRPFRFSGDRTTSCRLPAGPTRDLNLMVRRGAVSASFDVRTVDGDLTLRPPGATTVIVLAVDGRLSVVVTGAAVPMDPLDSVRSDAAPPDGDSADHAPSVTLRGTGTVAVLGVGPADPGTLPDRPA